MSADETPVQRPSIGSVDARVARLEDAYARVENRQLEQDGVMRLIQLEQQHIREIMTSRFVALEDALHTQGSKMDTFIGKMEVLVTRSLESQAELKATPLGRLVDERLSAVEAESLSYRDFRSEVRGMAGLVRWVAGGSAIAFLVGLVALAKSLGAI